MIAFFENQDSGGLLVPVAALVDQSVVSQGDNVIVPTDTNKIAMVYGMGATISQAQIQSPALRETNLLDVPIFEQAALPSVDPHICDLRDELPELTPAEQLQAHIAEAAILAEDEYVIIILVDEITEEDLTDVRIVRCVGATNTVANAWTQIPLVLDQQLQAGRYRILGMRASSATGIAARLILTEYHARPGCICYLDEEQTEIDMFGPGGLGNWGEFEHTFPPAAEWLSTGIDAAEIVYLAIKKIS